MNTALIVIAKSVVAATGSMPWQYQAGAAAGVAVLTILGGVVAWIQKRKSERRKLDDATIDS